MNKFRHLADLNRRMERLLESAVSFCAPVESLQIENLAGALRQARENNLLSSSGDPETIHELRKYRENLLRLQEALPAIQVQLSVKRTALNRKRAQMHSVSNWLKVGLDTL